jgi:hypothetical protein
MTETKAIYTAGTYKAMIIFSVEALAKMNLEELRTLEASYIEAAKSLVPDLIMIARAIGLVCKGSKIPYPNFKAHPDRIDWHVLNIGYDQESSPQLSMIYAVTMKRGGYQTWEHLIVSTGKTVIDTIDYLWEGETGNSVPFMRENILLDCKRVIVRGQDDKILAADYYTTSFTPGDWINTLLENYDVAKNVVESIVEYVADRDKENLVKKLAKGVSCYE